MAHAEAFDYTGAFKHATSGKTSNHNPGGVEHLSFSLSLSLSLPEETFKLIMYLQYYFSFRRSRPHLTVTMYLATQLSTRYDTFTRSESCKLDMILRHLVNRSSRTLVVPKRGRSACFVVNKPCMRTNRAERCSQTKGLHSSHCPTSGDEMGAF